jgi:hypothetical protein
VYPDYPAAREQWTKLVAEQKKTGDIERMRAGNFLFGACG